MDLKRYALISLGCLATLVLTFLGGRYSRPARVEVRTEVVEHVREVRTVSFQTQVKTRWRTVTETRPDGGSTVVETGETETETKVADTSQIDKDSETKSKTIKVNDAPRVTILVLAGVTPTHDAQGFNFRNTRFGLVGAYRFLGPLQAGAFIETDGTVGVAAGLTF